MNIINKNLAREDVIQHKKGSIKRLNTLLESYINGNNSKYLKKANLISYWIEDYARMIGFEEAFKPTKNIAYKRGDVLKVNFGFNIGAEYGGLHYAIVIDVFSAHNSPVITVIPLTSLKPKKITHSNSVNLGEEIFNKLNNKLIKTKYETIQKLTDFEKTVNQTTETIACLEQKANNLLKKQYHEGISPKTLLEQEEELYVLNSQLQKLKKIAQNTNQNISTLKIMVENLEKQANEIKKMKAGSIAIVNQITTVSKIRILDPKNSNGVLYGISISEENMTKINNKVKELYVL